MRGRRVAIAAVALALLGGCASRAGSAPGVTTGHAKVSDSAARALKLWQAFPATSSPRPLVLTGPAIDDPATGFPSGDDKLAYIAGRFVVRTTLPAKSGTWQQRPLITAAQAVAALRVHPQGQPETSTQLVIRHVRLGTATFSTDRGRRRLPAWVFTLVGVRDPASVLAIAPENRWPKAQPAGYDAHDLSATIGPDGHTVTVTFVGAAAGTGPCTARYAADVAQSSTAVTVSIRELPDATKYSGACSAVGYQRTVTVPLSPALAGRVLVDPKGAPVSAR